MESKHDKFRRLATARTEKVLDMIDLIGNLSNQSFYEYTEEEIKVIFDEIRKVTDENEAKFTNKKKKKGSRFSI